MRREVGFSRGLRGPTSTALYAASALRNVRLFVESGADVTVREEKYGTALCGTSSRGHANVVRFLRDNAAEDFCNTDSIEDG
jgi:ankyrin repeat protein